MKKLFEKDKRLRSSNKKSSTEYFVLKCILKNFNYFNLIRLKAFSKLKHLSGKGWRQTGIINRCVYTTNKKRLNNLTKFSRHVFLKQIRSGEVGGIQKSSW